MNEFIHYCMAQASHLNFCFSVQNGLLNMYATLKVPRSQIQNKTETMFEFLNIPFHLWIDFNLLFDKTKKLRCSLGKDDGCFSVLNIN